MRKTYITNTPDQAGAFLVSTRAISECGGNIVRVNYNKAVDANALFMEVDATEEQHERIAAKLEEIQYLTDDPGMRQIIMIELKLPDRPGTLLPTLEVIKNHEVNIPYINSQENGTPYQNFKMGLLVENTTEIKDLLDDLSKICEVRVLNYDATDRLLDSTVFYVTFANEMRELFGLSQDQTNAVLTDASRVMQTLDRRDESPREAFDHIRRYAQLVHDSKGEGFAAQVTTRELADHLMLYAIQPPVGGNFYVLEYYGALLFVDCGMGCYEEEVTELLEGIFEDFARRPKSVIITSPDVSSAGLLRIFDTVYLNRTCYSNFVNENRGKPSYRERVTLDAPYIALAKVITGYETPQLGRCAVMGGRSSDDPIELVGSMRFGDWTFNVLEGAGGHARGEAVITCPELAIAFTGAMVASDDNLTEGQREVMELQPYLMTTVDVKPELLEECRAQLARDLAGYTLYPVRGAVID